MQFAHGLMVVMFLSGLVSEANKAQTEAKSSRIENLWQFKYSFVGIQVC